MCTPQGTPAPPPCNPPGGLQRPYLSVFRLNGWLLLSSLPARSAPPPTKHHLVAAFCLPHPLGSIFSQVSHDTEILILLLRLCVLSFRKAGLSLLISLGFSPVLMPRPHQER